eukprot:TRINITY_DN19270_c0_g1_i2.p1 TRINITY_DN19270_c0_g1~~TRINITY_DN19270_c0_g1_i2.p1  ORF type:complete len:465 (-),score=138.10 TRINITY_DN19270_c0_g1_i2:223-1617(-)
MLRSLVGSEMCIRDRFWAEGSVDGVGLEELPFDKSVGTSSKQGAHLENAASGAERLQNVGAFDSIPRLQQDVKVAGYPMGGDQISITSGVVSRVDSTAYGGRTDLLAVQLDAAINRGNSGGPALCDEAVVGVAFQTLKNADNIGYIIPIPVVAAFLRGYLSSNAEKHLQANEIVSRNEQGLVTRDYHEGFGSVGFIFGDLQNKTLQKYLKVPAVAELPDKPNTGIALSDILPMSSGKGILQENDVVMAVNGYVVANDGTIEFRTRERISFSHVVRMTTPGENVEFTILRDGKHMKVQVPPKADDSLVPHNIFCPKYKEQPKYCIFGGLVFTPLTMGLLCEWGDDWYNAAPRSLVRAYAEGFPTPEVSEYVVVVQVLAHPINRGYEAAYSRRVTKVNGTAVRDFAHLHSLIEEVKTNSSKTNNTVLFETHVFDGIKSPVALPIDESAEADKQLMETYNIRKLHQL